MLEALQYRQIQTFRSVTHGETSLRLFSRNPCSPWMPSEDLLQRARRLDHSTLTEIHDRYYPDVFRYARYRLGDEKVAEDITSEVFLVLLDALHKRRGPTQNLRGWLLGTASNLVNDHLRRLYSRKVEPLELEEDDLVDGDQIEKRYDDAWQKLQVRQALPLLTAEQQHVLALRFADECSLEETAQIMGKSVTAIKALQFRAIVALRRLLDERT